MKKLGVLLLVVCFFAAGCSGSKEAKIASLEGKSLEMETRMESIEQRITALELYYQDLSKMKTEKPVQQEEMVSTKSTIDAMTDSDIQIALKNAGFYTGTIDGMIGPNTTNSIKEFQKANGLTPDGVAGDKTKSLLMKYLKTAGSEQ